MCEPKPSLTVCPGAAGPRGIDVDVRRLHDLDAERRRAVAVGVEIVRLVRRDVVGRAIGALRFVPGADGDAARAGVIWSWRKPNSIRIHAGHLGEQQGVCVAGAEMGDQVLPPSIEYCHVPFELSVAVTARPNCVAVLPSTSDGLSWLSSEATVSPRFGLPVSFASIAVNEPVVLAIVGTLLAI